MTKLEHCPFCGTTDELIVTTHKHDTNDHRVICNACGAIGPLADREISAVRYWNERASCAALACAKKSARGG